MLQQKKPDDYVISTGVTKTVKEFINEAAKILDMKITWKGKGLNEKGYDQSGRCIISCNKKFFRKAEVDELLGNSNKARKKLNWKPNIKFTKLVKLMVESDYLKESNYK